MQPNEPGLVSVITIFLDAERFLEEAVVSVLAQTYPRWELLLVDDGSSDDGTGIARRFAALHPGRIRYLEHPEHANRGMSASRNLGLRHARGEFVSFLDADDTYLAEKLERQVELLRAMPRADVIYGNTQYWYSWTGRAEDYSRDRVRRRRIAGGALFEPPALIPRFLRDEARTPSTCGILARRAAVDRAGGFEERFRGLYEDQVFFYKLAAMAAFYTDDGCYDRYRQHAQSAVHRAIAAGQWSRTRDDSELRRSFLEWVTEYLQRRNLLDPALRAVLRREMMPFTHPRLYRARRAAGWIFALPRRIARRLRGREGSVPG